MGKHLKLYVLSAVTVSAAILAALALPDFELHALALLSVHVVAALILTASYAIQAALRN